MTKLELIVAQAMCRPGVLHPCAYHAGQAKLALSAIGSKGYAVVNRATGREEGEPADWPPWRVVETIRVD